MTVEELLKPRYEVIADYPNNPYDIGTIFILPDDAWVYADLEYSNCEPEFFDTWPNLFRKMAWWEKRDIKDMPEYVKWCKSWQAIPERAVGDVMIIEKWVLNTHFLSEGKGWKLTGKWFEPATLEEYNNYVNANK